jgi:hypothetical protein
MTNLLASLFRQTTIGFAHAMSVSQAGTRDQIFECELSNDFNMTRAMRARRQNSASGF